MLQQIQVALVKVPSESTFYTVSVNMSKILVKYLQFQAQVKHITIKSPGPKEVTEMVWEGEERALYLIHFSLVYTTYNVFCR